MNRILSYSLAAAMLMALLAAGCGGRDQGPAPSTQGNAAVATPSVAAGDGSHAEGIVPGSYADWCEEHAVPETACTRCDASLVAAFKATGDWCEEHGTPKSQCVACDPALKITRAPKPEGVE